MEVLQSLGEFLRGIGRRFWLWAPALLLDPFDLYDRIIKPALPEEWRVTIPFPSEPALYVLVGLVVCAAVLTYHELRMHLPKHPSPDMKIKDAIDYVVNDSRADIPRRAPQILPNGRTEHYQGFEHSEACILLNEKANEGRLVIFGRIDMRPGSIGHVYELSKRPIPVDYWLRAQLDFHSVFYDTAVRPQTRPLDSDTIPMTKMPTFTDLHVCRRQLQTMWPRKRFWRKCLDKLKCRKRIEYPQRRSEGTS